MLDPNSAEYSSIVNTTEDIFEKGPGEACFVSDPGSKLTAAGCHLGRPKKWLLPFMKSKLVSDNFELCDAEGAPGRGPELMLRQTNVGREFFDVLIFLGRLKMSLFFNCGNLVT